MMKEAAKKFAEMQAKIDSLERDANRMRKQVAQLDAAKKKAKAAELLANEQKQLLDDLSASRFKIPKQRARKAKSKGAYFRVAYGDTHGSQIDASAWKAFLHDLEHLKPREIVHLGDIVECGGWLAQHHTAHYVAQTDYSYGEDIDAANQALDQVQAICPDADFHLVQGNHDLRVETACVTMAMRCGADAEFLRQRLDPEFLLHLEKRGIHWYRRAEQYGLRYPGSVQLGLCSFTHPQGSSKHHAANMASKWGTNVVYGHTHRLDYYPGQNGKGDVWGAWSPGCLCKLQKYYMHSEASSHNHGYHLQVVQKNGKFLPINVQIIDGQSYLRDLIEL